MNTKNEPHKVPKKSNLPRNIFSLVVAVIVLTGLYYHLQNPILVIGGAIAVILVHLAIAGGLAHIIPVFRKRFHREQIQKDSQDTEF